MKILKNQDRKKHILVDEKTKKESDDCSCLGCKLTKLENDVDKIKDKIESLVNE